MQQKSIDKFLYVIRYVHERESILKARTCKQIIEGNDGVSR